MTAMSRRLSVRTLAKVGAAAAAFWALSFLFAEPAIADDCDIHLNPLDCQNTAWAIGIIATAGAAAAGAAAAAAKKQPKAKPEKKKFHNCQAASDWLNSGADTGEAYSDFAPRIGKPTAGTSESGKPTLTVDVSWDYNIGGSRTSVVVPTWPNMSAADKAAVQAYREAAEAHEQGHHQVAKDFMSKAGEEKTGEGDTPKKARADLEQKLKEYEDQTKKALKKETDDYDDKTDHGRNQSAIGGQDVKLQCP
jgi:Bacterial protein of unknown function (DUF922)